MSKESERIARQVGNSLAEKKRLEEQERIQSILAQQKEIDNKLALEKAERESKQAYEAEIRRQKWEVFKETGIKEIFESIRDEKIVIWERKSSGLYMFKPMDVYAKIEVINFGIYVGWKICFNKFLSKNSIEVFGEGYSYVEATITDSGESSINGRVVNQENSLQDMLNSAFQNPKRYDPAPSSEPDETDYHHDLKDWGLL